MMEQLPDELWLLIYNYLHPFDILCSFKDLNTRFQRLIKSYQYDIDLSDVSLKQFNCFCQHILPLQGHKIRSLTLKNIHQIKLFKEKILQLSNNLQCLTLIGDDGIDIGEINFYIEHLNQFQHLTNLCISSYFELNQLLIRIAYQAPSSLTNLTLLSSSISPSLHVRHRMSNIKSLTIYIQCLSDIYYALATMINLEELNLSVKDFNTSNDMQHLKIPTSLTKLQLEFEKFDKNKKKITFELMDNFLQFFKNHLKSLILIIATDDERFVNFNQLQTLRDSFSFLKLFQYFIHTNQKPSDDFKNIEKLSNNTYNIYTTNPCQTISFTHRFKNDSFYSYANKISLEDLYKDTLLDFDRQRTLCHIKMNYFTHKLYYLYYFLPNIDRSTSNEIKVLSQLLTLSPNLNFLHLHSFKSERIIEVLKQLKTSLTRITHLRCSFSTNLCFIFFMQIAQILPHLKYFYLEQSISNGNKINLIQLSKIAIENVQKYFKNLINLDLRLHISNNNDKQSYEQLKLWLNNQYQNVFYSEYMKHKRTSVDRYLSIWL